MRRLDRLNKFLICLLMCFILVFHLNLPVYATEEESPKELSFNSVVEVESYYVEEGYIEAGKEATVNLTLHNANRNTAANSIFVSVSSNTGMIYPSYGNDNQFFVGTLEADGSATVSIPVVVNSTFKSDYADFVCNIVYVSSGKQISNTSTMILPARGSNTIIVSAVDVSAHANLNSKSLLSISYYNKSSENVNDAILRIDGNLSDTTKTIDLDAVLGGKTYTKDCDIIFTQGGEQTISIVLEYTDINGDSIQQDLGTFKVTVDETSEATLTNNSGNVVLKTIGRIIAFLAFAAVVFSTIMYIKKR